MKLVDRMCKSIRRRAGNIMLRSDFANLGSASQVSYALNILQQKGVLMRMEKGVYAKTRLDTETGRPRPLANMDALLQEAAQKRMALKLSLRQKRVSYVGNQRLLVQLPTTSVGHYVERLARRCHVVSSPVPTDQWANAVTRLAGDVVRTDKTENLLVALKRAGKVSCKDMTTLLINHLRERKVRV